MTADAAINQPRDLFAEAGIAPTASQPRDLFAEAGISPTASQPQQTFEQSFAPENVIPKVTSAIMSPLTDLASKTYEADKSLFTQNFPNASNAIESAKNYDLAALAHAKNVIGDFIDNHPAAKALAQGPVVQALGDTAKVATAIPLGAAGVGIAKAGGEAALDAAKATADIPGNIAGKAISSVIPPVEEETADLAKKATEAYKIPLALNQVSDSPALANIQKVSQELPLSGTSSFRNKQLQAVNRAVATSFGQVTNKISPIIIKKAYDDLGGQFNNLFSGRTIQLTPKHIEDMYSVLDDSEHSVGSEPQRIIKKNIDTIKKNISPDGTISGEKVNQLRTKIQEVLRSSKDANGEAADPYISKVLDKLLDASFEGLPPEARQQYTNLKYQYKNLITVTPVAAKAIRGNINPTLLEGAVMRTWGTKEYATGKAGALGDLAKISKTFLPHLGGSDTVQKALYAGAGLSASGGAAALAGVPAAAAGLAANRLYQAGNTSEKAVKSYLAKIPKTKP